jgi:molybdate transport system substrate-binding protein
MRHRVLITVGLLVAIIASACDDSGSEGSGNADATTSTTTVAAPGGTAEGAGAGTSGGIDVYAPPELTRGLEQLTTAFQQEFPGVSFAFTFAAGGELRDRIQDGEEPDLYISTSGDVAPVAEGDRAEAEPVDFGSDRLQLVVARGNPKGVGGLEVFGADSPVVAGLCEEDVACGYAGAGTVQASGVTPAPDVLAPSGAELLEIIVGGRADAGLVFRSDARNYLSKITHVRIPPERAVTINYEMLLMTDSEAARAFFDWIQTAESARQVLRTRGLLSFYSP